MIIIYDHIRRQKDLSIKENCSDSKQVTPSTSTTRCRMESPTEQIRWEGIQFLLISSAFPQLHSKDEATNKKEERKPVTLQQSYQSQIFSLNQNSFTNYRYLACLQYTQHRIHNFKLISTACNPPPRRGLPENKHTNKKTFTLL